MIAYFGHFHPGINVSLSKEEDIIISNKWYHVAFAGEKDLGYAITKSDVTLSPIFILLDVIDFFLVGLYLTNTKDRQVKVQRAEKEYGRLQERRATFAGSSTGFTKWIIS